MFEFDSTDELRQQLRSLKKRDKASFDALKKKIREVVSRDLQTIDFYKNLKKPLNEFKRVHVGSFVLIFKVHKNKNFIRFEYFKHHDEIYKRR